MGEEVFKKEAPLKKEKKKRELSQKQLDALAKGRLKAEEKRRAKNNDTLEKEAVVVKREQNKTKAKKLAEIEVYEKLKKKREDAENSESSKAALLKWESIRLDSLEKCANVEQFELLQTYLDKFTNEDIKDDESIKKKYKELFGE